MKAADDQAWLNLPCCDVGHDTRIRRIQDGLIYLEEPTVDRDFELNDSLEMTLVHHFGGSLHKTPVVFVSALEHQSLWTVKYTGESESAKPRSSSRWETQMPVQLRLASGVEVFGNTVDLGVGGIRCLVDANLDHVGETEFVTSIEFDGQSFDVRSRIVWWGHAVSGESQLVGIEFLDRDTPISSAIRPHLTD